jgi:uncharacterized protein YfaS (alpha-2-macroglobulin family)
MRTTILTGALLLFVATALTAAAAGGGTRVEMQILDRGAPVSGAQITVFLSCDKLEGTTTNDGRVVLESASNGGFYWVEIDGKRIDTLYAVERDTRTIDVSKVTFRVWQGGR